jgi:hypothetical protein
MLNATLRLLGERDASAALCPVCHRPVRAEQRNLRVRGMDFHRECAGYRLRREHVPAALRARSAPVEAAVARPRRLAA